MYGVPLVFILVHAHTNIFPDVWGGELLFETRVLLPFIIHTSFVTRALVSHSSLSLCIHPSHA